MSLLKILFIILALVIFYYIYVGLTSSGAITSMTDGKVAQTIDPSKMANNSGTSNYTYAMWMYVDNWNYRYGQPKVIFGRNESSSNGEANPSPSVVLGAMQNDLTISITTYPTSSGGSPLVHNCVIKNVPLQKWFAPQLDAQNGADQRYRQIDRFSLEFNPVNNFTSNKPFVNKIVHFYILNIFPF